MLGTEAWLASITQDNSAKKSHILFEHL